MNKNKSLKNTFYFLILPLVAFITFILFYIIQLDEYKANSRYLEEKLDYEMVKQSFEIKDFLWNVNEDKINSIFDLMIDDPDIAGLSLFDEKRNLFASSGLIKNISWTELEHWIKEHSVKRNESLSLMKHIINAVTFLDYTDSYYIKSGPIKFETDGNTVDIGTFTIILSDRNINRQFYKNIRFLLILCFIILLLISLSISAVYTVSIEKPIQNFKKSIINALGKEQGIFEFEDPNELNTLKNIFDQLWDKQKKLEYRLTEDRRLLNQTAMIAKIGGWNYDPAADELSWTDEVYNIHELNTNSGIDMESSLKYYHPDYLDSIKTAMKNALASGEAFEIKAKLITDKENLIWVIIKGRALFKDEKIVKISGTIQDVTDAVKIEEENRKLTAQLNHKSRMDALGQIASGIAHDFNNLLSGISGSAQLLKMKETDLSTRSSKYIDMILKASESASLLTNKLLTFARKKELYIKAVNASDLIENSIDILKSTLDKKIQISVIQSDPGLYLSGDYSSLQNVLINMCINSSQAIPEGGEIIISVGSVYLDKEHCEESLFNISPGKYLDISIEDSGCGIPPEDLDKIFNPFFTTKEVGKGTGLGLSAVYGIVKDHNGEITVESKVDEGTVFNILLPSAEHPDKKSEDIPDIIHGEGLILFVDDEEYNRELGQEILKSLGYEVLLASDGFQACEIYKQKSNEIDAVIIDYMMPKMNGMETFNRIREISKDCRIILSSGYYENDAIVEMRNKGLSCELRKPYKINELSYILNKVLNI